MANAKKTAVPAKKATAKKPTASKKVASNTVPTKAVPKQQAAVTPSGGSRRLTVRMYNVGFGDAFLVKIPKKRGELRILFDCGSIQASDTGGKMSGIVQKIIQDVTDGDGVARIDVVVATHRHKDHVSGFADEAWKDVEVKEVWMPWTEHPTDPVARKIREAQSKLALSLSLGLAAVADSADATVQRERKVAEDVVANALVLSNADAMKTLHNGFSGVQERRFLPLEEPDNRGVKTDVLPGVRIHVLGPSRDPDVIRDMDPPKGESYLRLHGVEADNGGVAPAPFASEFRWERDYTVDWAFTSQDEAAIQNASNMSALGVAVALDKAVNGTSLMLILEVAGTVLLFPGDAQWGTWMSVLEDPQWRELLQRVNFYKIGHHGSHNATPRTFVRDLLPMGCCAMASTLVRTIWPNIPKKQLLTGLLDKDTEVARSDKPEEATGEAFKVVDGVIEATVPF